MSVLLMKLKALRPWDHFHAHEVGARDATGECAPKDERAAQWW